MFYCWCFFFCFVTRSPSSVSRSSRNFATLSEVLTHDNLGPKKLGAKNVQELESVSDRFKLWSPVSPERMSKIGKTWSTAIPPVNFGPLTTPYYKHSLTHPNQLFPKTTISAPRGRCRLKFLHVLQSDRGFLAHTPLRAGMGVPTTIFNN